MLVQVEGTTDTDESGSAGIGGGVKQKYLGGQGGLI